MKKFLRIVVLGALVVLTLAYCSKRPAQEIGDVEAVINAAVKDGAEVYAESELEKIRTDFGAAMDEVNAQGKKFLKKYGSSREMLAAVKTEAEAVKALIPERKEQAKTQALTALEEAKAALEDAKTFLSQAPKGKGTKADIDAFTADLKGLEDSLPEVQRLIDLEEYFGASAKANIIKEKAAGISAQIQQAIEKVKKR